MKINKLYIPILIGLILAIGIYIGSLLDFRSKVLPFQNNTTSRDKIDKLLYFIENEYVEKIDTDSVIENTVNGIMSQLDPHSVYISKDNFEYVSESLQGNFVGIGINFYMFNDSLTVIRTIKNGPSEKAGIKAGDRILIANTDTIYGKEYSSDVIIDKLRGKQKSKLKVKVYRKSDNKIHDITIIRDVVPLKSVDIALKLNNKTGYIKVNRFAESTATEFKSSLEDLIIADTENIIIDLRDNGGGYLDAATIMADEFLNKGELIVSIKDKRGSIDKTFASEKGAFQKGNLIVLINENSASSSEIFAGAMQDNDRATIIGKLSYGKGLVQRDMPLGDGSMIRLTVAEYFTPSGRSIQKPYKSNESNKNDTLKYSSKSGKVLYSGGGISPDIEVENQIENHSVVFMMNSAISSNFVFEIIDKNRIEFEKLTFQKAIDRIKNNNFYFDEFKAYLEEASIFLPLNKDKKVIQKYLKAEFLRQLFSEEDYYRVILEDDPMIIESLNQLKN